MLVGNKCDLSEQRVISEEQGKEYAKSLGVPFLETSSKSGTNINQVSTCVSDSYLLCLFAWFACLLLLFLLLLLLPSLSESIARLM